MQPSFYLGKTHGDLFKTYDYLLRTMKTYDDLSIFSMDRDVDKVPESKRVFRQ